MIHNENRFSEDIELDRTHSEKSSCYKAFCEGQINVKKWIGLRMTKHIEDKDDQTKHGILKKETEVKFKWWVKFSEQVLGLS